MDAHTHQPVVACFFKRANLTIDYNTRAYNKSHFFAFLISATSASIIWARSFFPVNRSTII